MVKQAKPTFSGRKNNPKLFQIILLVFLVLGFFSVFFLYQNRPTKPKTAEPNKPTPTIIFQPTIQPTLKPTVIPTPKSEEKVYLPPASWHIATITSMQITVCLPPKWTLGTGHYPNNSMEIFFERDPQYRPRATSIYKEAYLGGSVANQYINSKLKYEPDAETLRRRTSVKEIFINGEKVFDVDIPSFPEVLVFTKGGQLFAVEVDPKTGEAVTSPSEYKTNIYTIVGCLKPL